jgi:putative tryptophan/tyrosine transport system substrate-binding protein
VWFSTVGFIMTLTLSLLVTPLAAAAQSAGKVPRLGVLAQGSPPGPGEPDRGLDRLRQGLRDLGYVEGQTIALEVRWDEQHPARWPDLATADLVQLHVDIIVAGTTAAALAAKQATSTIPIVIASSADPVGAGLVVSLAQPGGTSRG